MVFGNKLSTTRLRVCPTSFDLCYCCGVPLWSTLNRFRTSHGRCAAILQCWNRTSDPSCECGEPRQTTQHTVNSCPLARFLVVPYWGTTPSRWWRAVVWLQVYMRHLVITILPMPVVSWFHKHDPQSKTHRYPSLTRPNYSELVQYALPAMHSAIRLRTDSIARATCTDFV